LQLQHSSLAKNLKEGKQFPELFVTTVALNQAVLFLLLCNTFSLRASS